MDNGREGDLNIKYIHVMFLTIVSFVWLCAQRITHCSSVLTIIRFRQCRVLRC